jgi:hypothetical protein
MGLREVGFRRVGAEGEGAPELAVRCRRVLHTHSEARVVAVRKCSMHALTKSLHLVDSGLRV